MEGLQSWVLEHKLTSIGTIWATAVGASLAYRSSKRAPFKPSMTGTDIAKIARKWSKPDNHGHGNGIECAKAGRMLSKSYTSPNALIGQFPKGNDTEAREKTHQGVGFCIKTFEKEAQEGTNHGLPRLMGVYNRLRGLEASPRQYKYKQGLTHKIIEE
ncbi:putative hypoxia induced protein, domain-containing protein [Tanacetum coccineum]